MVNGRGRPRSFDVDSALEQALNLFWQCGYLGTSYADICQATGLTKPSLYAALGNKESTFLAALALYVNNAVQPGIEILEREPQAQEAVHALLMATVEGLTHPSTPPGCFIATNASCCDTPQVPLAVAKALQSAASQTRVAIAARLERGCRDAQLSADTNTESLSGYFAVVISGLSSMAKQMEPPQSLINTVDIAMDAWPK